MTGRRLTLAGLTVAMLVAGCARGDDALSQSPPSPPPARVEPSPGGSPLPPAPPAAPALEQVSGALAAGARLQAPVVLAARPGDDALYVAERAGRVRVVRGGALHPGALLDISDQTTTDGERGLLGLAFSPDGDHLYLSHTDAQGDSRVAEYAVTAAGVDPASRREVLFQSQPYGNHNGGDIAFGPDGLLYVGLGDGGSAGDPHDNGQSLATLLGKLLRIDPAAGGTGGAPYDVPPDNPFVGRPGARPEVWAYGLRNPWRFSFDRETGDLWIADAGQSAREEIDFAPAGTGAGANYGWNRLEGTRPYEGQPPPDAVPPMFEYPASGGRCAIIGGYVYRGSAIPPLRGAYLYSDLCDGEIRALVQQGGRVVAERSLGLRLQRIASFGQGPDGELYALSLRGDLVRIVAG
ncbi:MAG TPA: PQQ-dependent sugar dehydrogenase [Egibacteraceae bacterium]|nr:PQQ-dependent sugar dehydrogenase [Egibacteraceae bacterium]